MGAPKFTSSKSQYSYDEAWDHRRRLEKLQQRNGGEKVHMSDLIVFYIDCASCYGNVSGTVHVFDYQHELNYKFGNKMYSTNFVGGFLQLMAHDAHIYKPPYQDTAVNIKCVYCATPERTPMNRQVLEKSVTNIVTIAYNDMHYVVLYFLVADCTVTVLDGLNFSIKKWVNHVVYILKRYSLVKVDAKQVSSYSSEVTGRRKLMTMELSFDGLESKWTMTNSYVSKQADGINCGPLACY